MTRVALDDEMLENVSGGRYDYFVNTDTDAGTYPRLLVISDKSGKVLASYKGNKYMEADVEELRMSNPSLKMQDVIDYITTHANDFPNMVRV